MKKNKFLELKMNKFKTIMIVLVLSMFSSQMAFAQCEPATVCPVDANCGVVIDDICGKIDCGGECDFDESCVDNKCVPDNLPPIAKCQDVTVSAGDDCTADADVDDGSSDPDNDEILLEQTPPGPYPLGDTGVTLTVTDLSGLADECTATVSVVDTEAPSVVVTVTPTELWPPNHKMVSVSVAVTPTDNCDLASAQSCNIISVTSNEPDNGIGDGNTDGDIEIIGPRTLNLRAERAGPYSGRIYTITAECVDAAGNTGIGTGEVKVPHSRINGIVSGVIQEGVSIGLYKAICGGSLLVSTAITGSAGNYLFDLQPGEGSYAVIPENEACIFGPAQIGVKIPQVIGDFGPYDFTATD
jgi:hypothetical protein